MPLDTRAPPPSAFTAVRTAAPAAEEAAALHAALRARDARFDGRFFVGVTSTGVYCRPVCRVRTPLLRNCQFFRHAAQAEEAGFRPCLRCRPELAPGLSLIDSPHALAQQAARWLDAAAAHGEACSMPALAARLGVTDRHLRRIFVQAYGVGPLAYLNTRRLLQAKQLLTDTQWPVHDIARASGFGSLRRFQTAFSTHYRLQPSALRRRRPVDKPSSCITVNLGWRPPWDTEAAQAFWHSRRLDGLESVAAPGNPFHLRRNLRIDHQGRPCCGWIDLHLHADRSQWVVQISEGLQPALSAVLQRIRHALDMDADTAAIHGALAPMALPGPAGLRLPGAFEGFETAVRVILGQQITVAAARTLAQRLLTRHGTATPGHPPGLTHLFPRPEDLARASVDELASLGIIRRRVQAIQSLAQELAAGRLRLDGSVPLEPTLEALRALPGIGEWTAQLIALRVLGWPDAFTAQDGAALQAARRHWPGPGAPPAGLAAMTNAHLEQHLSRASQAWRPFRAYALMRLWQSLETRNV